jgi:hypothetical protein
VCLSLHDAGARPNKDRMTTFQDEAETNCWKSKWLQ